MEAEEAAENDMEEVKFGPEEGKRLKELSRSVLPGPEEIKEFKHPEEVVKDVPDPEDLKLITIEDMEEADDKIKNTREKGRGRDTDEPEGMEIQMGEETKVYMLDPEEKLKERDYADEKDILAHEWGHKLSGLTGHAKGKKWQEELFAESVNALRRIEEEGMEKTLENYDTRKERYEEKDAYPQMQVDAFKVLHSALENSENRKEFADKIKKIAFRDKFFDTEDYFLKANEAIRWTEDPETLSELDSMEKDHWRNPKEKNEEREGKKGLVNRVKSFFKKK